MGRQSFWFFLLVLLNGASGAETRLYLKTSNLARTPQAESQAGYPKRQITGRSHILLEFRSSPQEAEVLELKYRGAVIVGYVPDGGFIVSADDATSLDGLDLRRARWLRPEDKLSPLLEEAPRQAFVVEFHPDVSAAGARALVRELGLETREHPDLLPNHLLVEGTPERVRELAEWDEVAYIYPASGALVDGVHVEACPGALTQYGPIGQYVAHVGEGWAPGKGAAALGYFLGSLSSRLPRLQAQNEILRAFAEWGRYARITFQPALDAKAPRTLSVLFASGAHGDGYPFDGRGHVLAHTFYPAPPNPEPIAGDLHFDDDEAWDDSIDLFSVALHEAGHALGLGHSDRPGSVMYPYYRRAAALTEDDIAAIRELYASREATPADPPKPADPPNPAPPPEPKPDPQPPAPPAAVVLTITAPGPGPSFSSSAAAIQLAGTAQHPDGIARVTWSNARGGAGVAAGTRAWLAGPVPLQPGGNLLTVTAFTPTGRSASRTLTVTYSAGSDTVPPSVTILSPAGTSVLTYDSSAVLRGTANDNVGVAAVTWTDSTGATGTAQGTSFWTTPAIPLREGYNTLVIRARDAAGNTGWRSIVITRKRR